MLNISKELQTINNNKLSKVKTISKKVRSELEETHKWENNKQCFNGKCHDISKHLVEELKKEGIYSYRIMGQYSGADASYMPDMTEWTKFEIEEYYDYVSALDVINPTYAHWWVVAENKFIVDLASDQFFPGKENEHRVVITTLNDKNYAT